MSLPKIEVTLLHGTVTGMCFATLGDMAVAAKGLEPTVTWLLKLIESKKEKDDDRATAAVHSEPQ